MEPDNNNNVSSNKDGMNIKDEIKCNSTILSHHEIAILESGKKLYNETVDSSREFAKFMIQISFGSIPVYFAITKYLSADIRNVSFFYKMIFLAPPILFLISSIVFIFSFLPKHKSVSLDELNQIRELRNRIVNSRRILNLVGTFILISGILIAIAIMFTIQLILN